MDVVVVDSPTNEEIFPSTTDKIQIITGNIIAMEISDIQTHEVIMAEDKTSIKEVEEEEGMNNLHIILHTSCNLDVLVAQPVTQQPQQLLQPAYQQPVQQQPV